MTFADPWFNSNKVEFHDINVDELLNNQNNELSIVKNCKYEGPGWIPHLILWHQLAISEIHSMQMKYLFYIT